MADWSGDVIPSMPEPLNPKIPVMTRMGDGYAFTMGGLAHDITDADWEEAILPMYAPEGFYPETAIGGTQ